MNEVVIPSPDTFVGMFTVIGLKLQIGESEICAMPGSSVFGELPRGGVERVGGGFNHPGGIQGGQS